MNDKLILSSAIVSALYLATMAVNWIHWRKSRVGPFFRTPTWSWWPTVARGHAILVLLMSCAMLVSLWYRTDHWALCLPLFFVEGLVSNLYSILNRAREHADGDDSPFIA